MSRQSSQGTKFMVQSGALGASADIASATKAKPAVLTFGTAVPAGMVAGSVIVPSKTSWKSLDNRPFLVETTALLDATLYDSDTTNEANAFAAGAVAGVVTFSEACMATLTLTNPAMRCAR